MKIVLALVVVVLSALLLAAHFLRDAQFLGVAFSLGTPMVLLARRAWAVRVLESTTMSTALSLPSNSRPGREGMEKRTGVPLP